VKHTDHEERLFIGCVCDEILAYGLKPQCSPTQIGPLVTLVGERNQRANRVEYLFDDTIRGAEIFTGNVFPDVVKIGIRPPDGGQIHS